MLFSNALLACEKWAWLVSIYHRSRATENSWLLIANLVPWRQGAQVGELKRSSSSLGVCSSLRLLDAGHLGTLPRVPRGEISHWIGGIMSLGHEMALLFVREICVCVFAKTALG